jgi:D-xylose transport system substrate-binding protein
MKRGKSLFLGVSVLVILSLLVSCSGSKQSSASSQRSGSDKIKIGFAMKTLQEERWIAELRYVEAAANELGAELIVQFANNDSEKQISQIENLATQGIDVLMLLPVDGGAVANVVDDLHKQGVKIMAYDQEFDNAYCDVFVGYDTYLNGRMIARAIAEEKRPGNYVFLYGDQASGAAIVLLSNGMKDEMKPFFDSGSAQMVMEQYCKDWKAEEGLAYAENVLSQYNNNITAFICMNDGIASGAIQALESQRLAGKVLVSGMDAEVTAIQRIAAGTQVSTLFKDSRILARLAVETAIKIARGEDLGTDATLSFGINEFPFVSTRSVIITKDNLDSVLIDGGIMKREDIYK